MNERAYDFNKPDSVHDPSHIALKIHFFLLYTFCTAISVVSRQHTDDENKQHTYAKKFSPQHFDVYE